jgi:hypothetical protein
MDAKSQRSNWGRIGGLTAWSRNSEQVMLGPARRGFQARFEKAVDPDGVLPLEERERRAERARRAHMLLLAERSAAVRRMKRTAVAGCSAAAVEEHADETGTPRVES